MSPSMEYSTPTTKKLVKTVLKETGNLLPQLIKLIRSGYLNGITNEKKILKNLTNISFEYKN